MIDLRPVVVAAFVSLLAAPVAQAAVTYQRTTINGVAVDRYLWTDSAGLRRSVALKREGAGNTGHGGFAVQMTYQYRLANGSVRTVTANAPNTGDGGFGYFVSHERYRDFTDGANATVAGKIFGKDDSPLGRGFAVVGSQVALSSTGATHRFTMSYPRYGTIAPIPKDADGNDVTRSPTDKTKYKLYTLPVRIDWVFQDRKDHPRIHMEVGFGDVPGPDRVNFDLRGPYGVLRFDNNLDRSIDRVMWGDRFHFSSTRSPLTRGSTWTWAARNGGARYNAQIAAGYEMGLVEPTTFATSKLADNWSSARGRNSTTWNGGRGCGDADQLLPCDWEWPYQSAQYSLPQNRVDPTDFKKMAWGSSPFYGTGPSMTRVFDTDATSEPFVGYPSTRKIVYDICVVLGRTIAGGLTKKVAAGPSYSCAGTK